MSSYGVMSLTLLTDQREREPRIGDLRLSSDPVIFCDYEACDFIFLESSIASNPEEDLADMAAWQPLVVASDRKVSVWTTCDSSPVLSGGDGTATELEYRLNV